MPSLKHFSAIALLFLNFSATAYAAPNDSTDLTVFPQDEDTEREIDAEIARLRIEIDKIEALLTSLLPDSDSLEAAVLQDSLNVLKHELTVALIKKLVPTLTPSDPRPVIPTIDPIIAIDLTIPIDPARTITPFTRHQEYFDKHPELKPFYDRARKPWNHLSSSRVVTTATANAGKLVFKVKGGLSRDNPSSIFWYANPQVDLPDDGEYGLNVKRPHKVKGLIVMNQDDFKTHLEEGKKILVEAGLSEPEIIVGNLAWAHVLNTAIQRGYNQWLRHLDYYPRTSEFEIGIEELERAKAAYRINSSHPRYEKILQPPSWLDKLLNRKPQYISVRQLMPTFDDVIDDEINIDSTWLLKVYHDYMDADNINSVGDEGQAGAKKALEQLTHIITHEAGHQFGYEHPNGDIDGCGMKNKCHGPEYSGSVMSYDHHKKRPVNYGVTEEDVKHIPNATYNDNRFSTYRVSRSSTVGEYGVWEYGVFIVHEFQVTGQTKPGFTFGGSYSVKDAISARGFAVDSSWDDQPPSISATYSGADNFVGASMSPHFLGAVLRADASLRYTSNSSTNGNISLTLDDFKVYYDDKWRTSNFSITYQLDCYSDGTCGTKFPSDKFTSHGKYIRFASDGQYVGGYVGDISHEYVGAFRAEKD